MGHFQIRHGFKLVNSIPDELTTVGEGVSRMVSHGNLLARNLNAFLCEIYSLRSNYVRAVSSNDKNSKYRESVPFS